MKTGRREKLLTYGEVLHENPWFSVRLMDGFYAIEENMPQVIILPVVQGESILMVRMLRPVIEEIDLELPAGGAEQGEIPVQAAARELGEETGITIEDLDRFVSLPALVHCPRSPVQPFIFRVDISTEEFGRRARHSQEIESVDLVGLREFIDKTVAGEMRLALHIAIVMRFILERYGTHQRKDMTLD